MSPYIDVARLHLEFKNVDEPTIATHHSVGGHLRTNPLPGFDGWVFLAHGVTFAGATQATGAVVKFEGTFAPGCSQRYASQCPAVLQSSSVNP